MTIPFVGATKDGSSYTHFGYIFGASYYEYNDDYVPASLKTVTALNGYCLKEVMSQKSAIIIEAERTEKSPIKTNKDWLNLTNPYSLINLFLQ
jgi:hypothetical protein